MRQDFQAGWSAALIFFMIVAVITSYGSHDSSPVTVPDILFFLLLMAVFASCSIDVYRYWQRRHDNPHQITLKSLDDAETFARILSKRVREAKAKEK